MLYWRSQIVIRFLKILHQLPTINQTIRHGIFQNSVLNRYLETQHEATVRSAYERYIRYFHDLAIQQNIRNAKEEQDLDFGKFISELNKSIIKTGGKKLSKVQEMDWMEIYERIILEVQTLNFKIEQTDREIDQLVYGFYGLSGEEIRVIEESVGN